MFGIDDAIIAAGISSAGSLLGGLFGNRQQTSRTNTASDFNAAEAEKARRFSSEEAALARQFNAEQAEINRTWSAGQAATQMGFQERMASTAHQREIADLRAAGLNPILSVGHMGAAVPIGASGTGSAASGPMAQSTQGHAAQPMTPNRIDIGNLLSSAVQIAQIKNIESQTDVNKANENAIRQRTDIEGKSEYTGDPDFPTQSGLYNSERWQQMRAERRRALSSEGLNEAQRELVIKETDNAVKEGRRIEASTRDLTANAVLRELAEAESSSRSKWYKEHPDIGGWLSPLKDMGGILNSAGEAVRKAKGLRLRP